MYSTIKWKDAKTSNQNYNYAPFLGVSDESVLYVHHVNTNEVILTQMCYKPKTMLFATLYSPLPKHNLEASISNFYMQARKGTTTQHM